MSPRLSLGELYLRAQPDERLVTLAADGSERAFTVLAARHRRALVLHAARIVRGGREEDVVQQALLRAWTALGRGAEVERPEGWLHRIVHNTAVSELARVEHPTEQLSEELADLRGGDETAEQRLQARAVIEGISALPERQRLALVATELQGQSRAQIGQELGLSEGAVRQLVHRARAGVRAAAAAVVPWPLLVRLARFGNHDVEGGAAGHGTAVGATLAGGAVKVGTAVLAVGALGGVAVLHEIRPAHAGLQPRTHLAARPAAPRVRSAKSAGFFTAVAPAAGPSATDPAPAHAAAVGSVDAARPVLSRASAQPAVASRPSGQWTAGGDGGADSSGTEPGSREGSGGNDSEGSSTAESRDAPALSAPPANHETASSSDGAPSSAETTSPSTASSSDGSSPSSDGTASSSTDGPGSSSDGTASSDGSAASSDGSSSSDGSVPSPDSVPRSAGGG